MKVSNTAERLKEYMDLFNCKQADILNACAPYCKKLNIKLGRNDLSQYVSGKVAPRQDKLSVLAAGMGVDEAWLMGYDVPMYVHDSQVGASVDVTISAVEKEVIMAYRAAMPVIKDAVHRLLDIDDLTLIRIEEESINALNDSEVKG